MIHTMQFSPADVEVWSEISEFPEYRISNMGNVLNSNGDPIKPTCKPEGLLMVGLMAYDAGRDKRVQYKRSLPLLVARAFLPPPVKDSHDTPIILNGDRNDNRAANMAWRPRWFAREYMAQFKDNHITYPHPIENVETFEVYESSMAASIANGLIDRSLILSMHVNTYVFPTNQIFRKV